MMRCFVIMPFDAGLNEVYQTVKQAVESAVPGEDISCYRLDEINSAGRITDDLLRELSEAVICVADVTGNNPNVMWELGYAVALRKPILIITQNIADLPFDLKDMRAIEYDPGNLHETLYERLARAFRDTLGFYEDRVDRSSARLPVDAERMTIAVTGSASGSEAVCKRRIESLLWPYMGEHTTWLCGSSGLVDECAVNFLADRGQSVFVVGYHSYDISSSMLQIIEQRSVQFIDAQKEQLPKGLAHLHQSPRDILFLTKADLLVALWNGTGTSTKALIDWFSENEKNTLLGFF